MARVRIKFCGVNTPAGVSAAVAAGADALGFVFADSPRRIDPAQAAALCAAVPAFVARVAVFHHPTPADVQAVCAAFAPDLVQTEVDGLADLRLPAGCRLLPVFHDSPDLATRVRAYLAAPHPSAGPALLLEGAGRGGRGVQADWGRVAGLAREAPVILAGGLRAANVGDAVRTVRPYAVDASSAVETAPGVKDPALLQAFVAAVRAAEGGV